MPGSVQGPDNNGGGNPSAIQITGSRQAAKPEKIKIIPLNGQGEFYAPVAGLENPGATIFTANVAGKENTTCMKMPDSESYHCQGFQTPADAESKGLEIAKLANPGKFEVGKSFDKTVAGLVKDESLTRWDVPHDGNKLTEIKFFKGGTVSDDGKKVEGGKLVATYRLEDGKESLTDAKERKFVPDADHNIAKM